MRLRPKASPDQGFQRLGTYVHKSRMKARHAICINKARARDAAGGAWEQRDPVAQGRVQLLTVGNDPISQAQAVMSEFRRLLALAPDANWSRCAVIAREWADLVPVRAFCEAEGIPVQMGNEEAPGFWRLRETQAFITWLRAQPNRLVDGSALHGWLATRPSGPWYDLLRQAVEEHNLETGGGEASSDHVIEWLAEWGRSVRRRQRGLLTSHSAKGLEFDHVAVLDGNWDRVGRNEDGDAPRRLYYVAMTRARQTLVLAQFKKHCRLQEALIDHASVIQRPPITQLPAPTALRYRHLRLSLKDVHLGFAGYRDPHHAVHHAIAALSPGDPLAIRLNAQGVWALLDQAGTVVGHLAKTFAPPTGMRCRSAQVLAVVVRSREVSEPQYRDHLGCDVWEVVVPELVFEPIPGQKSERRYRT